MLSGISEMATERDRQFHVLRVGGSCRKVIERVGADKIFNLRSSREEIERRREDQSVKC